MHEISVFLAHSVTNKANREAHSLSVSAVIGHAPCPATLMQIRVPELWSESANFFFGGGREKSQIKAGVSWDL